MEKGMPQVINIGQQIEALAIQGLIFEFWGGFEKYCFSNEFSVGPKSTQNVNCINLFGEEGCQTVRVGGTGGVRRALGIDEYGKRSDTPLSPRSERRGRQI